MNSDPFCRVEIETISYVINMGYIVFLRRDGDDQVLPICIGPAEAQAIAAAYNKLDFPRPMTHDLIRNVLRELDYSISRIRVTELKDGTFFARVFVRHNSGSEIEVDARPSDAIAMALRWKAPIFVHENVLRDAGVSVESLPPAAHEARSGKRSMHHEEAKPADPLEKLQSALEQAVAEERYEDAARLRDELQKLQKGN